MLNKLDLVPCKAPLWPDSGPGPTLWAQFIKSPELEYLGKNFEVDLPDGDRLFCFCLSGPLSGSSIHYLSKIVVPWPSRWLDCYLLEALKGLGKNLLGRV